MNDERVAQKLDEIQAAQSGMRADLAALRATVDTTLAQHNHQIEVLFDSHSEVDRRVGEIERSYVPRTLHERDADANSEAHSGFARAISDQRARGAWVAGGVAAVLSVVAIIIWVVEKIWSRGQA